jgi:hypothetical protein
MSHHEHCSEDPNHSHDENQMEHEHAHAHADDRTHASTHPPSGPRGKTRPLPLVTPGKATGGPRAKPIGLSENS